MDTLSPERARNPSHLVLLSGGVGGARLARGLAVAAPELTVVVNVGDDEVIYGLDISPDLDTVLYTLAGWEGPEGWGIADDGFEVLASLARLGVDTRFLVGDRDFATHLYRTLRRRAGAPLSEVTAELVERLGITIRVLPATDDAVPTRVLTTDGKWLSFQEYFVLRQYRDPVRLISFVGVDSAGPAPGVVEAIEQAETVIIGPSNPPLSIWPILAIPGIRDAVASAKRVIAVSPLIGGMALKGPAADVLRSLGFPPGNQGVVAAYADLLTDLVVDDADAGEKIPGLAMHTTDIRIGTPERSAELARWLVRLL